MRGASCYDRFPSFDLHLFACRRRGGADCLAAWAGVCAGLSDRRDRDQPRAGAAECRCDLDPAFCRIWCGDDAVPCGARAGTQAAVVDAAPADGTWWRASGDHHGFGDGCGHGVRAWLDRGLGRRAGVCALFHGDCLADLAGKRIDEIRRRAVQLFGAAFPRYRCDPDVGSGAASGLARAARGRKTWR